MSFENLEARLLEKAKQNRELVHKLFYINLLDLFLSGRGGVVIADRHLRWLQSEEGRQILQKAMNLCRKVADEMALPEEDPESMAGWLSYNISSLIKGLVGETRIYYSPFRFAIHYPAGWQVRERHEQVSFNDGKGIRSFNVIIKPLIPGRVTVKHFEEAWRISVKSQRGKEISSRYIIVADEPAFEGIHLMRKFLLFSEFYWKVKKVVLVSGKYEYQITGGSPIEDFTKFEPILDYYIQSLIPGFGLKHLRVAGI